MPNRVTYSSLYIIIMYTNPRGVYHCLLRVDMYAKLYIALVQQADSLLCLVKDKV